MGYLNSKGTGISVGWCKCAMQLLTVTLGVLLLCASAFAQGSTGRILGTVTDQSGGTVAGATVSVIDTARGVTKTLTTDDAGEYNVPNLTPGTYVVRAEAKGFKRLERQNIVIEVGKEVRVDLTVQPGEQEQTVTVTEAVPLVETTNATLGGTLDNADITDMPLNGRNYQNLLSLRPGVMTQVGGGPWTQSTNGVRPDESAWMIEGVINHNFFDVRPIAGMPSPITDGATILPIDSIQEFNLMENPKAEYGWAPGAVVNVGIRSGTNSLHGTAYGFYRSSNWDARNYFNPAAPPGGCPLTSCDKVPTQLKQFGASIGGPIIKDKLFFFGNYEGLRDLLGNAIATNGVPETIAQATADPAKSMVDAINGVIAQDLPVSAVSLAVAGCKLGPPVTCTGGFFPNNPSSNTGYVSTFPNVNSSNNGVVKIDYHINDKNTLNGLLILGRYNSFGEDHGFINKIYEDTFKIDNWTASGAWDYTPNSTMVNEVRFGYNRMAFPTGSLDAGVPSPVNTGLAVPGQPGISISGFNLLGTWHNRPQSISPNPYQDIQDNFSYLAGKHALKFGVNFTHIEADDWIPDYGRGQINFTGGDAFSGSTSLEDFFAGVPDSGKVLVGDPTRKGIWNSLGMFAQDDWRMTSKLIINLGLRYDYKGPIREANNLWANFDPTSPTGLVQQGQPGLGTLWKPERGDFSPRFGFAYDMNGKGTTVVRGGFSVIYSTFSMVEWMNQNQFQNSSSVSLAANPTGAFIETGNCAAVTITNCQNFGGNIVVKAAKVPGSSLNWNGVVFPSTGANIACGDGLGSDAGPCALMGVDPNLKTPYVINYNFGVTHAFGNNLSLEVGYVGNHGARLTGFTDINACLPSATGNCVRPYGAKFPYFSYINYMTNDTRSNYNSMQVALTKRLSHGVSFVAGYTYAHGLDNGSLNRFGLLPQNPNNPGAEYGNSDFDVRHRLTLTGTYNIPGIKGFAQMLEGWQVNGILTLQSSQPWVVDDYSDNFSGTGDSGDRWDFFGNPSDFKGTQNSIPYCTAAGCSTTSGAYQITTPFSAAQSSAMWAECTSIHAANPLTTQLTAGCYVSGSSVMMAPANGTFGTMGRNIFRDSGFKNVDFSVFKNFKFRERYSAQFRLEIFNVFNHPVIANPYGASNGSSGGNNDPSAPGAFGGAIGTPDVVAGNPVVGSGAARDVQVGLKIQF